eukprot:186429-Rhodomonas_salina.1
MLPIVLRAAYAMSSAEAHHHGTEIAYRPMQFPVSSYCAGCVMFGTAGEEGAGEEGRRSV